MYQRVRKCWVIVSIIIFICIGFKEINCLSFRVLSEKEKLSYSVINKFMQKH